MQVPDHALRALERAEIDASVDLYRAASHDVAASCGLSIVPAGGAVLLAANALDVLALNRVVGLGLEGVPSDSDLLQVLSALDACGSPRGFVQVAPCSGHEALAARLEQRGLRHYNNWMRLHRDLATLEGLPPVSADLEVRPIGAPDASTFGQIVASAFGYPPALAPLAGQAVGRPRWSHYLASVGGVPAAAAAMYVSGEAAWFGFAATDAAHRKRGAQRALVLRRLRDAAQAGCRWVSVETAEDTMTRDAPSFRNLLRLGFEVAYRRPNYLWTRPA